MPGFSEQGAARIVRNIQRLERMPRNQAVPNRPRYPIGGGSGFWAQITSPGSGSTDQYAGKYSWVAVSFNVDGTVTPLSGPTGDRTQASGFARETTGLLCAPQGALVYLTAPILVPNAPSFYLFRYDLCFLGRSKVISSYPNSAGAFFAIETQTISGTQVEGGAATISTNGDTVYALNVGTAVPPQGTLLVVSNVSMAYGGSATALSGVASAYLTFRYDG